MTQIIPSVLKSKVNEILQIGPYTLRILTLSGENGAGKDTWASLLRDLTDGQIIRFADPVRKDFEEAGIPGEKLDIVKRLGLVFPRGFEVGGYEVGGMTPREALIHVAETNKEKMGQYFYANKALSKITDHINSKNAPCTVIIPDLRFEVEHHALESLLVMDRVIWINLEVTDKFKKVRNSRGQENSQKYEFSLPTMQYL